MNDPEVEIAIPRRFRTEAMRAAVDAAMPVAELAADLAAVVRKRVRDYAETASGGVFRLHRQTIHGAWHRPYVWIEESRIEAERAKLATLTPRARKRNAYWTRAVRSPAPSQSGKVLVQIPAPRDATNNEQYFNYTGVSWKNLKAQITGKGRVRVNFTGSALPGWSQRGAKAVRNAMKMSVQNSQHDEHMLEPSSMEVEVLLDAICESLEYELKRILMDSAPP